MNSATNTVSKICFIFNLDLIVNIISKVESESEAPYLKKDYVEVSSLVGLELSCQCLGLEDILARFGVKLGFAEDLIIIGVGDKAMATFKIVLDAEGSLAI